MNHGRAPLLVVAALSWSLLFLGTRPLADPDEGRYGEASREMLVARHPWYPTLGGRPHLTKPPLTYWISATGMKLTPQPACLVEPDLLGSTYPPSRPQPAIDALRRLAALRLTVKDVLEDYARWRKPSGSPSGLSDLAFVLYGWTSRCKLRLR